MSALLHDPSVPPPIADEDEKQRQLVRMQRRATGLLVLAAIVFVVARVLESRWSWLGFVPPRIEARLHVTGALDPTMVDLQEKIREHGMYPKCFDVKTAQLMLFGMLLMDGSDAAILHGIAARRAGASWAELQDTINLCFLFRGLSAANKGAELLANLAQREEEAARAGKA